MKNRAGFTLVELMVAVAIIALLAGLGGPSIIRYLNDRGVTNAATQVYLDLQRIRTTCITQRRTAVFTFNPPNNYSVAVTDPSIPLTQNYPATAMNSFRGNVSIAPLGPDLVATAGNISFNIQGSCPISGPVYITNQSNTAWYRIRTTLAGGISFHVWDGTANIWKVY